MELFGIYWAQANRFILFPVFLLLVFLLFKDYLNDKKIFNLIVYRKNQNQIFNFFSYKKLFFKFLLKIIALVFIFIAMLQPQWSKKEQNVQQEGRDLLIALDISRSMLAQDLKPNRIDFAKLKIRKLLKKLDFERVGLILFSGSAFLQCPLTADHSAFLMLLDSVGVETISSGTTSIGSAILKATQVFKKDRSRKNKLLLLITDGEDFSLDLNSVRSAAQKEDLKIFSLGVGTKKGAPIPLLDEKGFQIGHEVESNGSIAVSKLNEIFLRSISENLNGKYFKFTYDDTDLNSIKNFIYKFEKEKFDNRKMSNYEDQYPWFLAISFICLALEWVF